MALCIPFGIDVFLEPSTRSFVLPRHWGRSGSVIVVVTSFGLIAKFVGFGRGPGGGWVDECRHSMLPAERKSSDNQL